MNDKGNDNPNKVLNEVVERKRELRKQAGIYPLPANAELFKFQPGSPRRHYAVVNGLNTWDAIAEGQRLGAEKLAEFILKTGNQQDFLVYPILFLYRCYLETRLKQILVAASGGPIDAGSFSHDLQKLWKQAEPLIRRYAGSPPEYIRPIGRYIAQFHEIDPNGQAFRYPTATSGGRHLLSVSEIDVGLLRQVMESIASELDGASTGLDEERQNRGQV